ncbi:hypothetical protein HUE58_00330 [Candidatus Ruthia endofausta]|uniref:Uncharacterized protein n=1 Tax=Candidatus Ruthia endofausta TaxID=2738852 RepID=A0A6N0HMY6_9GAMM|nr:hypothetical protein [Candidatus Ruthia endofausta]QKQ23680.1 hypothetical protein HUE58_00330 [Candidatus Ruthia endofausta]
MSEPVLDMLDVNQELLDAQVALTIAQKNEVVIVYQLASILGSLILKALKFPNNY